MSVAISQKINVNFRIEKAIKEEASKIANEMRINLTSVVDMFLKKFVREKKIEMNLNDEIY